jgi:hypothetical protein
LSSAGTRLVRGAYQPRTPGIEQSRAAGVVAATGFNRLGSLPPGLSVGRLHRSIPTGRHVPSDGVTGRREPSWDVVDHRIARGELRESVAEAWGYFVDAEMPLTDGMDFDPVQHHEQQINYQFCDLAGELLYLACDDLELAVGLRKLLEARDCFVRNALMPPPSR